MNKIKFVSQSRSGGGRGNVGARYRAIEKRGNKFYFIQDDPLGAGIRQEFGPFKTKQAALNKMGEFAPALNYRDLTEKNNMAQENIDPKSQKKHKGKSAPFGSAYEPVNEIGIDLTNYKGQILPGDVLRAPKGFPLGGKKLEKSLALKVLKNSREGVNRYKLTLEDPKTEKRYSVRNCEMDRDWETP